MSGETKRSESAWHVDTLKEHLEALIASNDKRYQQRFDAQESANAYAQEKSNEFRGALDDIGKHQMPRTEAEALIKSVEGKIDAIASRLDRTEGRSGGLDAGWKILIGAIALAASLVTIVVLLKR